MTSHRDGLDTPLDQLVKSYFPAMIEAANKKGKSFAPFVTELELVGRTLKYDHTGAYGADVVIRTVGSQCIILDYKLYTMPTNCGMVVLGRMVVSQFYRFKGIGKIGVDMAEAVALKMGYSMMLCSTTNVQAQFCKILEQRKWSPHVQCVNGRTGNTIKLWSKVIKSV